MSWCEEVCIDVEPGSECLDGCSEAADEDLEELTKEGYLYKQGSYVLYGILKE